MASNSAILSVLVEANTTRATSSLKRFDHMLDSVDRRSVSATTRTSALGKASGSTGRALASAAKYAAGAAVAYLSIAKAKEAVATTQDLAKTTAGLNRNLGLTVKEGSRWAAVAKSRDVDAKSLTMSFTTLSRRLVDTSAALKEGGSAAETAMAPFKRLGISQQEVVKGSKDLDSFLPKLADAFGGAAGGAERQASAQQLLGRGYQSLLPLFADGAKGLREQQHWADEYGATLNNKTLKAQMALVQSQRESKVAWLGLQLTFTRFVTPALEGVEAKFQRIARIMGDKRLTDAERFKKVGEQMAKWAQEVFDAFVEILPDLAAKAGQGGLKIAGALVEGFMKAPALGKLALGAWFFKMLGGGSAIRSIAGRVAGGIFGRTTAGGGVGGVGAALASPGMTPTRPLFVAVVNELPGGGGGPKIPPVVAAGLSAGEVGALAATTLPVAVAMFALWKNKATPEEQRAQSSAVKEAQPFSTRLGGDKTFNEGIEDRKKRIRELRRLAEKPIKAGLGFDVALKKTGFVTRENVAKILDTLGKMPEGARKKAAETAIGMAKVLEDKGKLPEGSAKRLREEILGSFDEMQLGGVKALKKLATDGGLNMDALRKAAKKLRQDSGGDVDQLSHGVGKATGDMSKFFGQAGKSMDDTTKKSDKFKKTAGKNFSDLNATTSEAMHGIFDDVNQVLKSMGVAPIKWGSEGGGTTGGGGGGGGGNNHQRGGIIKAAMGTMVPGRGSGDKVPALLEPGEVVINRKAAAAMGGSSNVNRINSMIPRFAGGGVASGMSAMVAEANKFEAAHFPYLWGGGHGSFGIQPVDCSGAVSDILHAGGLLQGAPMVSGSLMGWGQPATGNEPVVVYANPHHTVMSLNGKTFGTSGSNPGGGAGWIEGGNGASLAPGAMRTMKVAGAVAAEIARTILKGPASPLKDLGQAALDKVRGAANRYIDSKVPTGSFGGGDPGDSVGVGPGILSRNEIRRLLQANSMPDIMGFVAYAESGGDPNAGNGSYEGLWALGSPFWSQFGGNNIGPWMANVHDPNSNAKVAAAGQRALGMQPWEASRNEGGQTPGSAIHGWGGHLGETFRKGGIASSVLRLARGTRGKGGKGGKDNTPAPFSQEGDQTYTPQTPYTVPEWSNVLLFPPALTKDLETIQRLSRKENELWTEIQHQAIIDAFSYSPAGSELSPEERAGEIAQWDTMIGYITQQQSMLPKLIHKTRSVPKVQKGLQGLLTAINDPLGADIPSLLWAQVGKDAIVGQGAASGVDENLQEMLDLQTAEVLKWQQRYNVSQAQYAVFGGMQTGGVAGVPQVSASSQAPSNADVRVYNYADGRSAVTVNGERFDAKVEKVTRRQASKRPMPGVRG